MINVSHIIDVRLKNSTHLVKFIETIQKLLQQFVLRQEPYTFGRAQHG